MFKICAFFTPEYSDEVKHLKESCAKYGYDCHVQPYPSKGNWKDNTYIKPEFIMDCMYMYEQDILYLDADAVIMGKLPFFDKGIDGDVSYHTVSWNAREEHKTLSGTMYFSNNAKAKEFLGAWIQKRLKYPNLHGDQALIPKILNEDNLDTSIVQLPFEYVKIFDKRHGGTPVIQHNQASRRLKNVVNNKVRKRPVENKKMQLGNYEYSTNKEVEKYSLLHKSLKIASFAERAGRWAFDRLVNTAPKIIDIGCGSGLLRAFVPYQYYVGLDIASHIIKQLQESAKENEEFIQGDASQLNTDVKYDIAYCINTLQHLPEEYVIESIRKLCSVSETQIISVDIKRNRMERADDYSELNITVRQPMWWEGTIGKFTKIREKCILGDTMIFFGGEGYKNPNEIANVPFQVRMRPDGGIKLLRADRTKEVYLDERFNRLSPNQRIWYPRVDQERVVAKLKDIAKDETVYIIGKGPSLDHIDSGIFAESGPVLAINESVDTVQQLGLLNHIYLVQQDPGLSTHPEQSVILHERIQHLHPQIEDRYLFNKRDFSTNSETVSVIIAIRIALLMGCSKIVLVSFDAATAKETGYANCIGHTPRTIQGKGPERFLDHKNGMLKELGHHAVEWVTPKPL